MFSSHTTRGRTACATVIACLALAAPAAAQNTIVVVQRDGDEPCAPDVTTTFTTIHLAVKAAQPGDHVLVCEGVYDEHEAALTIDEPITLSSASGADDTKIVAGGYQGIWIKSSDVVLGGTGIGFTIEAAPNPWIADVSKHAVEVEGGAADVTVQGNTIVGFTEAGISIDGGADGAQIIGNEVQLVPLPTTGISALNPHWPTAGIVVNSTGVSPPTNDVEISGNTVTSAPGVGTDDPVPSDSNGAPEGAAASGVAIGVLAPTNGAGSGPRIHGNIINGRFSKGIVLDLQSTAGATLDGTEVIDNTIDAAGAGVGISLHADVDLSITNSVIDGNHVQGAGIGIGIDGEVEDSTVSHNDLVSGTAVPVGNETVEPSTNALDLRDATTEGRYDDGSGNQIGNLYFDNDCFAGRPDPTPDRSLASSYPAGLCELTENVLPVAPAVSVPPIHEDVPAVIELRGEDAEDDDIDLWVTDQPQNGTFASTDIGEDGQVEASDWRITYTSETNFHGSDAFTYVACDKAHPRPGNYDGCSSPQTVSITVDAVNDVPRPAPVDPMHLHEDLIGDTVGANVAHVESLPQPDDEAADTVTLKVTRPPSNGHLIGLDADGGLDAPEGDVTYVPNDNFNGTDSFEYVACDSQCTSLGEAETVKIDVTPINDPPTADPATESIDEDTPFEVLLGEHSQDVDLEDEGSTEKLTYAIVSSPDHGTLSAIADDGSLTYTPSANYHGADAFTYEVSDGQETTAPATVSIDITPVNDAPTADAIDTKTDEDTPVAVSLAGHDVDAGAALAYTVVEEPEHGELSDVGDDGSVTYTPAVDYHGADAFTYEVSDGEETVTAQVDIDVTPVNDLPEPEPAAGSGDEDGGSVEVHLSAVDVDGDEVSFELVDADGASVITDAGGKISLEGSVATYTPATNYHGTDSFRFLVCDADGCSKPETATVTIVSVNDPPVAKDGSARTVAGDAVVIDLQAGDADGDALSYQPARAGAHGTVTIDGSRARYVPAPDFAGMDSFRFRALDPDGAASDATVTVEVAEAPPSPGPVGVHDPLTNGSGSGGPAPVTGRALEVTGTVLVTLPGGAARELKAGSPLPQATVVDARRGTVTISPSGAGPAQRLTASQGAFVVRTKREHGHRVLLIRMITVADTGRARSAAAAGPRDTARLVVTANCRCRVVSRDASVTPLARSRWTTVQHVRRTAVSLAFGRVLVTDRYHTCTRQILPRRRGVQSSPGSRNRYEVPWTYRRTDAPPQPKRTGHRPAVTC